MGYVTVAAAYASSAGTDMEAYDDVPDYHLLAARNLIATDDESYHGSARELPPATSHKYAEWAFSGVPDLVMFQRFLDAVDYWFGYSDTSSVGSHGPECECCMGDISNVAGGANATRPGEGEDPRTRG
jgi:hypothetical protein